MRVNAVFHWASKLAVPVVLLMAVLFPFLTSNTYFLDILVKIFIWTIAVSGMNIIAGYTGQLSLAHAGFFGIGAYAFGLLMTKAEMPFLPSLALAVLVTGLVGSVAGIISLRLKGHYFAIFSLCVGVVILLILEKWESLTEGVRGLLGIPVPTIGFFEFSSIQSQYYLILFFLVLTFVINKRIIHSLVGKTFISIRNSEELAEALGIHVMRNKMIAFVHSTVLAGLAGALYAGYIRFLGPDIAHVEHSFDMLLYLLVGGISTVWGPLVGTMLVIVLMQWLQSWQEYRMIIFGPILVALVMFLPHGIIGALIRHTNKHKRELEMTKESSSERSGLPDQRLAGGEMDA
jgi:branched-chain amino acid transport system permease protein